MIDAHHQMNAVRRTVGTRTFENGEARSVTISQSYGTSLEDLWDACTNAERIPRWFLPVSGDLRLGGSYRLEGNAHGVIRECDPPHRFLAEWDFADQHSWIEVRLRAEAADRTRFTLEHITRADEHWEQYGPGAVGIGWDLGLIGLATHLGSGQAVDPGEGMAWLATPEGRQFIERSGELWCAADIGAGNDVEQARAAAERTAAAYSG